MTEPSDVPQLKKLAREQANKARAALTVAQKHDLSRAICEKLLKMPATQSAKTIAAYSAMKDEVQLDVAISAFRERGARVLFPCSVGNRTMYFHELGPDDRPNYYEHPGKLWPDPHANEAIPPSEFDLVIIPGVAFDEQRNRCGYGGGYYDTLLSQLQGEKCALVAVAFDEQFVERVPLGPYDKPMPVIITPTRILRE